LRSVHRLLEGRIDRRRRRRAKPRRWSVVPQQLPARACIGDHRLVEQRIDGHTELMRELLEAFPEGLPALEDTLAHRPHHRPNRAATQSRSHHNEAMRLWSSLLLSGVASLCGSPGCSSAPAELSDPDVPPHATNPDGVPYPADHIGSRPRVGKNPGDRIPNLTFEAYVNGDKSQLKVVSLADFYDPTSKKYKMLHIEGAATWCAICGEVADATVIVKPAFEPKGIVYLEVLVSGATQGKGPSGDEVNGWIDTHHSNYTTAYDVRARRMSTVGVDGTVMPYDIYVDLRTMEIDESSGGAPADIGLYDQGKLQEITGRPPAY
jgi:hypothetical protein